MKQHTMSTPQQILSLKWIRLASTIVFVAVSSASRDPGSSKAAPNSRKRKAEIKQTSKQTKQQQERNKKGFRAQGLDPIEQRADVFDRVLALFGVVERHKHLAIPVGATHVRINHRHAELRGQKLDDRREVWAVLAFRTAMRVDDHRNLALFARPVDERADLAVVERLVADQIGRDEVRPVEPPDLRLRPPR
eukprot:3264006-Rhodomonas_salina.1